ncbi:MAG: [LysW]-lysine hydrolase [Anaerolineales bacterium]|nr:[LysW]-lysine hydrolase [Anaerolineales bacterium]
MDEIALLSGLAEHYSPSGQEAGAVNYLVGQMRAAGFEAGADGAGNAVGEIGSGPETVVLLGHIDTVPGNIAVTRDGDRLNGRGTVDAKGPLAAFTAAAARVGKAATKRRIVVIGAVGEESAGEGAQFIKALYRPAFTIIGEPSSWNKVTLGYKGSVWFEYEVKRVLAHTSARRESACEAAVAFWNRVTTWAEARNAGQTAMFAQALPTLRMMGSGSDGFVEWAKLRVGVRLPPGLGVAEAEAAMIELAQGADMRCTEGVPAYRGEKNTPLVRAFLAAIRQAGGEPSFTVKSGTSDMNVVAPVWGTPIMAYGPGDSNLDHTPEEHILVSEYLKSVEVLEQVLRTLCA